MNIKNLVKSLLGINNIKFIKSWFRSSKEKKLIKKRKEFYSQFLIPNSVFFDIGANYGNRIEPLINENIKIIAVEPQEECVRFLKKKYGNKITILQNGVGEKIETKLLYISTNANILSSFSKDWINSTKESGRFKNIIWNETREIEMVTLDYLISKFGSPSFIKIDVEGFELEVLKGLTQSVKSLSLEYTVPERKDALLDCLCYLNTLYNSNIMFNYCKTEFTEFSLSHWVNYNDMIEEVNSTAFLNTKFGDVYVKLN
ncbi:FkbM family methyltransferase [Mariniflexile jejuense]|uniref:FkbM family methyltransferase n=1 Tax=Mariniflexile jejuense TaxID=1173582 RepID=A0ABW3JH43_9FLAO